MQDYYFYEVNKDLDRNKFFELFPKRPKDANKGSTGKILLISGSYGMAGAASLNILGAKALGAPYIHVALPAEIYPICASVHMTPVYHPYESNSGGLMVQEQVSGGDVVKDILPQMKAVCFGSGAVNNFAKRDIFNTLLNDCRVPLVLDAEALKIIKRYDVDMYSFRCPVIITPHQGEFSVLADTSLVSLKEDPVGCACTYSADHNVITVLKGPETIVAAPDGRYYVNKSGNQGLAQTGSGDVLAGMITAMLTFCGDPFDAACMAVFAHGMAADELAAEYSKQLLPLEKIPQAMDRLFFQRGF